jgi:hypothetical protein
MSNEEPVDILPVRQDIGPHRRFIAWNFCEPVPVEAPRMRSATMESNTSIASGEPEKDGLEQALRNVKDAWDNLCQPAKLDADTARQVPVLLPDTTEETTEEEEEALHAERDEMKVTVSVIVTEPGTSRSLRVYRGLELFALAVFVFVMTLRLLQRYGIELGFVLEAKVVDN